MRHTPWTKPSLPSDRLAPRPSSSPQATSAKGKGKASSPAAPRSKAVQKLDKLLEQLQQPHAGTQRDKQGGCFCLSRSHTLSRYTPICTTCGLVLCELNAPYHACPHCGSALFTPAGKIALLAALDAQLAETVAGELDAAERAREEARRAAGAFPTLSASSSRGPSPAPTPPPAPQTHKVLSLGGGKRVTVASYTTTPRASPAGTPAPSDREEPQEQRVPPPPPEPDFVRNTRTGRRWENLHGTGAVYVPLPAAPPPPTEAGAAQTAASGRRRRKKGKGPDSAVGGGEP